MIRSYITAAVRNLLKYKGYSVINVIGLAIGLAGCVLMLLYVQYEFSYDGYHEKKIASTGWRIIPKCRVSRGKSPSVPPHGVLP